MLAREVSVAGEKMNGVRETLTLTNNVTNQPFILSFLLHNAYYEGKRFSAFKQVFWHVQDQMRAMDLLVKGQSSQNVAGYLYVLYALGFVYYRLFDSEEGSYLNPKQFYNYTRTFLRGRFIRGLAQEEKRANTPLAITFLRRMGRPSWESAYSYSQFRRLKAFVPTQEFATVLHLLFKEQILIPPRWALELAQEYARTLEGIDIESLESFKERLPKVARVWWRGVTYGWHRLRSDELKTWENFLKDAERLGLSVKDVVRLMEGYVRKYGVEI